MRALKIVLGLLVLWAVGRHMVRTWYDLRRHGESVRLDPGWMAGGAVLYLAGLSAFGLFYGRILVASPTPVAYFPALRAYLISHLGKYVPGKAMVVVMRAGLLTAYGARPATAAFAALYETLTMMAAGGFVATAGFLMRPLPLLNVPIGQGRVVPMSLLFLSLGLGIGFLVLVEPRVFPRLSRLISVPFPGVGPDALPHFSQRLLAEGMGWSVAGWGLLGLSQVAVIRSIVPGGAPVSTWPLVVASVALATVAGFAVAIFPGGLVVREGVLMATLVPVVGTDLAVVSALALRLAWVVGEVAIAAVLSLVRPLPPRTAAI
ncbi:MAG: hypothetical protein P4L84_35405 [Isosphaeraceae bacterium]|nr:hypothetical protein [Isosphaeraceae bacterium]